MMAVCASRNGFSHAQPNRTLYAGTGHARHALSTSHLCIRMRVRLFLPAEKQGRGEKSAFALGLVKIFFVLLVFFTF